MLRVTSRILATGSYQPSGKLGTLDRNNNKTVGGSYIQNRIKKINKLHYPMIDSARLSNYQMSKHSWEMGIRNISTARDEKFRKLGMYRKYEVQKNVKGMRSIREKYGRTILETLKGDVVKRAVEKIMVDYVPDAQILDCIFVTKRRVIIYVDSYSTAEILNQERKYISHLLADFVEEPINPIPQVMFTHLHLSDSELNKKLENLEEEQRQINIIEEEKARQQLREHQRLQELEVEEPLEESSIDFYGIDPKKSEQLASSIKTAFEKQTLNTWRKTLKSPLYPLTGIDHNRVNGRILYRYRTNKERAKYIDDHSIDTGEYRFEHHPFEKVINSFKNKAFTDSDSQKLKEANYFIKPEDRETDPESGKEFYTMEDEIASREQQNRKKFAELVDLSNPDLKKFETPDIFISFENLDKIDNVEL